MKYDFYKTKEDINVLLPETKELLGKINKGDAIIRVGSGLVVPNLPIETMYFLEYDNLLKGKYIERITDEMIKLFLAESFDSVIKKIELKITTDVLTYLEIYKEFIYIPNEIKSNIKRDFDDILANS